MREADLTDWNSHPVTLALVALLRTRRAGVVMQFLQGQPVAAMDQGRAAALYELHKLLTSPPADLKQVLENALKEVKTI